MIAFVAAALLAFLVTILGVVLSIYAGTGRLLNAASILIMGWGACAFVVIAIQVAIIYCYERSRYKALIIICDAHLKKKEFGVRSIKEPDDEQRA